MQDNFVPTPFGIAFFIWLFIFAVLWLPLPIAVYGFKDILRKILNNQTRLLEAQEKNLDAQNEILDELKRITGEADEEDEHETGQVAEGVHVLEGNPPRT